LGLPDPDPDPSINKQKSGKPFVSTVLFFLNNFLSLKTDVNEPSESKKTKKLGEKKLGILKLDYCKGEHSCILVFDKKKRLSSKNRYKTYLGPEIIRPWR
jgi:hypothetical protein